MDLQAIRTKRVRFVIGLMSGTSCDGVDAALVRIKGSGPGLLMKLVHFETVPYDPGFKTRLLTLRKDAREIALLNFDLGHRFADATQLLLERAREEGVEVDFIASHGHTLAHIPPRGPAGQCGTLQIGEPAVLAERAGLPVISNFRPRDMAAGGQGAPLVPYADWLLFAREDRTVVCLNLGGIGNLTVVTPESAQVLAFDTGPVNMAIDGAVRLLTHGQRDIDQNGEAAAKGVVIDEFLDYLLDHPFFQRVPPKSTGADEFGPEVYLRDALESRRDNSFDDLLATVTASVAYTIIRAYNRFVKDHFDVSRIIINGGGAHNETLVNYLKKGLGPSIRTSDEYGIPSDAREAISFAILGNETVSGLPANLVSATGAKKPVVLGNITPP
jgi:anhydro-N-acetylmuramic acid kinase